jgi:type I restriction enzyme, S subunit
MKAAPLVSLAEIAESVRYGYTASASDTPIGPKFLRITDIVPPQIDWDSVPFCKIDESDFERFSLKQGDIVVARTGATVGYAKLIRDDKISVFASYLVRIRIDPKKADADYVGHIVESELYKRFVLSQVGGAAQPNANARILSSFRLPIPEHEIQKRIASILSTYDELIGNNLRRIFLLEQTARALFKEWFVRLRYPGHEHHKIVDGVPEGWEKKRIAELAETIGGGTPSTAVAGYWEGGDITWFVPTDITNNGCLILLGSERKITEAGLKNSSARILPRGSILMTSRASVGFFGIYDEGDCCTNQGFISICPRLPHARMYMLHDLMRGRKK